MKLDLLKCDIWGFGMLYPKKTEAESEEKHGVWDSMPELTITSPYVRSRVDSNTFTIGPPYALVDLTL